MARAINLNGRRVQGLIKSIQRGSIVMAAVATATATISTVDTSNSLIHWYGENSADFGTNAPDRSYCTLALTNSTTVTASRASATNTTTVGYEVVEYWPGVIKSVQRGTIIGSGNTATINAVDITRTTLEIIGRVGSTSNFAGTISVGRIALTNSTTITSTGGDVQFITSFQVVEWN